MAKQDTTIVAVALILIGIAALSDPNCDGGCKTWAEHLLSHGLEALV